VAAKLSWSEYIPLARVQDTDLAWTFTERNDVPSITKLLTIHWRLCGLTGRDEILWAVHDFLEAAGGWFKRHQTPWVHISWRENHHDDPDGEHLHMALHLPRDLVKPFDAFCRKTLIKSVDALGRRNGSAIKITPPGDKLADRNLLGYLAKGGDQIVQEKYDAIIRRTAGRDKRKGQGRIFGQRVFISQSINAKAQGRADRKLSVVTSQPVGEETTYWQRKEKKELDRKAEVQSTGSYMDYLRKRQAQSSP
jgi:hypothetical protein